MIRSLLAVIASLSLVALLAPTASSQEAEKPVKLQVGDKAPEFVGVDDAGEEWKSEEHVGKKILVVYFYPKDMTSGCTRQACNYRDAKEALADQDVEVIGVSGDTVESHQEFKKKEKLNFTLLADPEGKLAKAFGVKPLAIGEAFIASRWTFVIDLDGKIAFKDDDVDAAKDTANVLKVVAGLKKP
jgi:peroxiredoxin Q/BCP